MITSGLIEIIPSWILISLGLILLAIEMFSAFFILLWFGLGFIAVGMMGFAIDFGYGEYQLIIATAIGVFLLLAFRKRLLLSRQIGEAKTLSTYEVGGEGRLSKANGQWVVFYNGTFWTVANPADDLEEGKMVKILEIKSNRAIIEQ